MSTNDRPSPRDAIYSWLSANDVKPDYESHDVQHLPQPTYKENCHSESQNPKTERHTEARKGESKHNRKERKRRRRSAKEPRNDTIGAYPVTLRNSKHHQLSGGRSTLRPDEPGFAERLGLHAPFRTFQDPSPSTGNPSVSNQRKRRRRKSTVSSCLELAIPSRPEITRYGSQSPPEKTEEKLRPPRNHDNGADSLSDITDSSIQTVSPSSPKETKRPYERQPRRKTRADRYDLKEAGGSKKQEKNSRTKQQRRVKARKYKEKSGAALMHGFFAKNVSHDRLTLQPGRNLGIFGKGRASSPIRRKGLPDLAFSEAAFLNPRRSKIDVDDSQWKDEQLKKKGRSSKKAADNEAQISGYFNSTNCQRQGTPKPLIPQKYKEQPDRSLHHDKPQAFVQLPNTPFLGFGSRGTHSVSPIKKPSDPVLGDHGQNCRRIATRSTSYLTWSQSGVQSPASPQVAQDYAESSASVRRPVQANTSMHPHDTEYINEDFSRPGHQSPAIPIDELCKDNDPPPNPRDFDQALVRDPRPRGTNGGGHNPGSPKNQKVETVISLDASEPGQTFNKDTRKGPFVLNSRSPSEPNASSTQNVKLSSSHAKENSRMGTDVCVQNIHTSFHQKDFDPLHATLEDLLQVCKPVTIDRKIAHTSEGSRHGNHEARNQSFGGNENRKQQGIDPDAWNVHDRTWAPKCPNLASFSYTTASGTCSQPKTVIQQDRDEKEVYDRSDHSKNFARQPDCSLHVWNEPFTKDQIPNDDSNLRREYPVTYEFRRKTTSSPNNSPYDPRSVHNGFDFLGRPSSLTHSTPKAKGYPPGINGGHKTGLYEAQVAMDSSHAYPEQGLLENSHVIDRCYTHGSWLNPDCDLSAQYPDQVFEGGNPLELNNESCVDLRSSRGTFENEQIVHSVKLRDLYPIPRTYNPSLARDTPASARSQSALAITVLQEAVDSSAPSRFWTPCRLY